MSLPHKSWADEVEREEKAEGPRPTKFEPRDGWHEGLDVRRDQSKQRIDMSHGFVQEIIRNQHDRDQYERAWQVAYAQGDEYTRKWGRAKVQRDGRDWGMPEPWRSAPQASSPQDPLAEADQHSKADDSSWWRRQAGHTQLAGGGDQRTAGRERERLLQQLRVLQRPSAQTSTPAAEQSPAINRPPSQAPPSAPAPWATPPQQPAVQQQQQQQQVSYPSPQVPAPAPTEPSSQAPPLQQQFVLQYSPQGQVLPAAPFMVALPGGGYALMHPQAQLQAQQQAAAVAQQGSAPQTVHLPVAIPPIANAGGPASPLGAGATPAPAAAWAGQSSGTQAASGALAARPPPGDAGRRTVKVRAGFATYRPPPVLTGVSSTGAKEVRELERPTSREAYRPAAAPQVEGPASQESTVQRDQRGPPSVTVVIAPRVPAAQPAQQEARGSGPGRGEQQQQQAAQGKLRQEQQRQRAAVQRAPELQKVLEQEEGEEEEIEEGAGEGSSQRRRKRRAGKKNRKGRGAKAEAGPDDVAVGDGQGRLSGAHGLGPAAGLVRAALGAAGMARLDSIGRRRSGQMVLAEQDFDENAELSGLDNAFDISGTSPASSTAHSLSVTLLGRASSRLSAGSAYRVVTVSAVAQQVQHGVAGNGDVGGDGDDAASSSGSFYSDASERPDEGGYSSGSSSGSGWYTEEEPTEADLAAAAAGRGTSSAAKRHGAVGSNGEGRIDVEKGEELVVSLGGTRSRDGRREVHLSPSQGKAQEPAVLEPPPGISRGRSGERASPAPLFAQPPTACTQQQQQQQQQQQGQEQAAKRVSLGPMPRLLQQHLQAAVQSRVPIASVPVPALGAAGGSGRLQGEGQPGGGEEEPGGEGEALPQREGRRRRGAAATERGSAPGAPPGLRQQQQQDQEEQATGEEGLPAGAAAGPCQSLAWRQERILQRIMRLECELGGMAGAGGQEDGSSRPVRQARAPLMLYMPPRGARQASAPA